MSVKFFEEKVPENVVEYIFDTYKSNSFSGPKPQTPSLQTNVSAN